MAEHRRLSEARDAAAERTIKSLQTENERLKRELAEARQEAANKAQAAASEVANDSVSAVLMQEREEKISELQKCKCLLAEAITCWQTTHSFYSFVCVFVSNQNLFRFLWIEN